MVALLASHDAGLVDRIYPEAARARERSEIQGFMKLLVDAHTERFFRASMFGIRCDEVVHAISYLMQAGVAYRVVMRAVPIHPCVAELIPTMLKQARAAGLIYPWSLSARMSC